VLAVVVVLFVWGGISFHNLPIDAYPDVANNYVNIITQWPGHSRRRHRKAGHRPGRNPDGRHSGHEESALLQLAGISSIMMIFDDASDNSWNREHVLERLSGSLCPPTWCRRLQTDWSPAGQIYWYTIESKNPPIDVMEQKSLEDWVLEKQFKGVPGVVDVASFGGITKEYQIRLDPDKLIAYGLSIAQVEQQIANNNTNAGGSFIEQGRSRSTCRRRASTERAADRRHRHQDRNGAAIRVKDIATVDQGPKIRLGQIKAHSPAKDGKIIDNPDVVEGSCCCARAPTPIPCSRH
jgi:heavy metal efflux system protein